jgi:hypothetical protein
MAVGRMIRLAARHSVSNRRQIGLGDWETAARRGFTLRLSVILGNVDEQRLDYLNISFYTVARLQMRITVFPSTAFTAFLLHRLPPTSIPP